LREDDGSSLSKAIYPAGTVKGQAGWDWGLKFHDLSDLVTKLTKKPTPSHLCGNMIRDCPKVEKGQVSWLAIAAHGAPGAFAINGDPPKRVENKDLPGGDLIEGGIEPSRADVNLCRIACEEEEQCQAWTYVEPGVQGPKARCYLKSSVPQEVDKAGCTSAIMIRPMTAERIRKSSLTRDQLTKIGNVLSDDAVVLIMGCNSGATVQGSELLIELSKIWPGRKVVGFTKVMAFMWKRNRKGESCSEVGYRDTEMNDECWEPREKCEMQMHGPDETNFTKLPWGSEFSLRAKVAQNGKILTTPCSAC
jgi:hypothetical protein